MQHMHQPYHKWYDPLHTITWPCWFINLNLTCFSPLPSSIGAKSFSSFSTTRSITPKPPTCPSRLQPVHQAKSCLDLLHLDHMTLCHVSCAISSFIITCVSFATSLSHHHRHGICCSHTYTCGLITCVSHLNTLVHLRLSLNYQNQIRTFHHVSGEALALTIALKLRHHLICEHPFTICMFHLSGCCGHCM